MLSKLNIWHRARRALHAKVKARDETCRRKDRTGTLSRRTMIAGMAAAAATPALAQWQFRAQNTALQIGVLASVQPSATWNGSIDLTTMPAASPMVYGSGWTAPPIGHFRRPYNDWVTAGDNALSASFAHGDRAGLQYVEFGLQDGTSVKVSTPFHYKGRFGYHVALNNLAGGSAGEILAWARAVPWNGVERVVSMRITLDTIGALPRTDIFVGYPGASEANDGKTAATSVPSTYYAAILAQNAAAFPNARIKVMNGATVVEPYTVAGHSIDTAATYNRRRVDVVCDTIGGSYSITRSDRVFIALRGVKFTTSGVSLYLASSLGAQSYNGLYVKRQDTGEVQRVASSSGKTLTLASAFSSDVTAALPMMINTPGLALPLNNMRYDGATFDMSTITSVNCASTAAVTEGGVTGVYGSQMLATNCAFSDLNGWSGPGWYSDVGYPAPSGAYVSGPGYFLPHGTNDYGGLGDYNTGPFGVTKAQGLDGRNGTLGAGFWGTVGCTFAMTCVSGMTFIDGAEGIESQDINYLGSNNTRQFNNHIKQRNYPYLRAHAAHCLTVASVAQNTAIAAAINGTPSSLTGYTTIYLQESKDSAGINCEALKTSGTVTAYNDAVRFLTGSLAAPWDTSGNHNGNDYAYVGSGYTTMNGVVTVFVTVRGSIAPAVGDTLSALIIQHPDGNQFLTLGSADEVVSNIYIEGQITSGRELQVLFQDSEQLGIGYALSNGGVSITVAGDGLSATFAAACNLAVGDFVVKASDLSKAACVTAVAADKLSCTFASGSAIPAGTYAGGAWNRESGMQIAGTAVTLSSPSILLGGDFIALYDGVERFSCARVLNASGSGATGATLAARLVSCNSLAPIDVPTWTRWTQGKAVQSVAYVACLFNSGSGGHAIEGPCYNFLMLQCAFHPLLELSSTNELPFRVDGPVGSRNRFCALEAFVIRDSIFSSISGGTSGVPYYGAPAAAHLPYAGLVLDNNRYLFPAPVADGHVVDPTGVTTSTAANDNLTSSRIVSTQAIFDPLTFRPSGGVGLVALGNPLSGRLCHQGDAYGNPLTGPAAGYLVGALQAA